MNLNAASACGVVPRFFNYRVVDATGIEPVHPRLTTSSWRIEGRSCASCDSFLGYQLGEPDPGADGRPLLTRSQRFRGRTNPDRHVIIISSVCHKHSKARDSPLVPNLCYFSGNSACTAPKPGLFGLTRWPNLYNSQTRVFTPSPPRLRR